MRKQALIFALKDIEFFWPVVILVLVTAVNLFPLAVDKSTILTAIALFIALCLVVISFRKRYSLYSKKQVPFLVAVQPEDKYRDMLTQVRSALDKRSIPVDTLQKEFDLEIEDWRYHHPEQFSTDSSEWFENLYKVESKFYKLASRISGEKNYHLFLNCPSAFALALGAVIGSRSEYVAYHFQPGTGGQVYYPQIDFSRITKPKKGTHFLKDRVQDDEYKYVKIEQSQDKLTGDLYIALNFAGHSPASEARNLAEENQATFVKLFSQFEGTIALDEDWILLTKEIRSRIESLSNKTEVSQINLFLGMPVVIAFALGASLGPFKPINVWHWFRKEKQCRKVFTLNEL